MMRMLSVRAPIWLHFWRAFVVDGLVTRLNNVGEASVLCETSTVFAAFIGWPWFKERVGPVRFVLGPDSV